MVRFSPNEPEQYRPLKNALQAIVSKIETGFQIILALNSVALTVCKTTHTIQRCWNAYRSSIALITNIC